LESADRNVLSAVEQELGHDLLHPSSAGLAVGGDDDIVVAERKSFQMVESKWWLRSSSCFCGHGIVAARMADRIGAKILRQ
jgi:hypothetical protein